VAASSGAGGLRPAGRVLPDITAESGLTFRRIRRSHVKQSAPTTLGGAVVVFDYNGTGNPDLFFVNGAPWPGETPPAGRKVAGTAPFPQRRAGALTDVSHEAGLDVELQGMGATAGAIMITTDIPTGFVACVGRNPTFFRNRGDGRSRMSP